MDGEVGVESEPGRGSTFWFTARLGRAHGTLPFAPSVEVTNAETKLRTEHGGSHILLVEDNAINREVALELLCGAGLAVDTAKNGLEAIEKVRAKAYDLMDLQMPEMDGLEVTCMIRSLPANGDLPILSMTANLFEEDRQAYLEAGMNDFVAKPVYPENLLMTIAKWLTKPATSAKMTSPSVLSDPAGVDQAALYAQLAVFNDEGMDTEIGLRNMRGDVAGYLRLLRQFDSAHHNDMRKLSLYLENDEALRLAHTLNGAAGTLGLPRLRVALRALETNLRVCPNCVQPTSSRCLFLMLTRPPGPSCRYPTISMRSLRIGSMFMLVSTGTP